MIFNVNLWEAYKYNNYASVTQAVKHVVESRLVKLNLVTRGRTLTLPGSTETKNLCYQLSNISTELDQEAV